jgi:hypothetical protein
MATVTQKNKMEKDLIKFNFLKEYEPERGERFSNYSDKQKTGIFEDKITSYDTIDKYQSDNKDELWEYERIPTINSGLAVDIFVDDGESYKLRKHPKWIYFRNSYDSDKHEYLPILIDKCPRIPAINVSLNISYQDLNDIKRYVLKNYHQLTQMADGKGVYLSSLYEDRLSEMATLKDTQMEVSPEKLGNSFGWTLIEFLLYPNKKNERK